MTDLNDRQHAKLVQLRDHARAVVAIRADAVAEDIRDPQYTLDMLLAETGGASDEDQEDILAALSGIMSRTHDEPEIWTSFPISAWAEMLDEEVWDDGRPPSGLSLAIPPAAPTATTFTEHLEQFQQHATHECYAVVRFSATEAGDRHAFIVAKTASLDDASTVLEAIPADTVIAGVFPMDSENRIRLDRIHEGNAAFMRAWAAFDSAASEARSDPPLAPSH